MNLPLNRLLQLALLFAALATAFYAQVESRSLTPTKTLHQPSMDDAGDGSWSSAAEITMAFLQITPTSIPWPPVKPKA
jgi:hypothetical protein